MMCAALVAARPVLYWVVMQHGGASADTLDQVDISDWNRVAMGNLPHSPPTPLNRIALSYLFSDTRSLIF